MNITAISTGRIRIKNRHRQALFRDRGLRLATWFLDPTFTEWLPIYTWVIDHPDGVIVVDTGETIATTQPEFYPQTQRGLYSRFFGFDISPQQELASQLKQCGIDPLDVKTVVVTHGHIDHVNGFNDFPNARLLFSRREYNDVRSGNGYYLTYRWSRDLKLEPIDYVPQVLGSFAQSYPLTQDGKVQLVPTPGHTPGHQSVIVQDDDKAVFIAGDCAFSDQALLKGSIDGVAIDEKAHGETQRKIIEYAKSTPTVFLPSHDPDSGRRLEAREILQV